MEWCWAAEHGVEREGKRNSAQGCGTRITTLACARPFLELTVTRGHKECGQQQERQRRGSRTPNEFGKEVSQVHLHAGWLPDLCPSVTAALNYHLVSRRNPLFYWRLVQL